MDDVERLFRGLVEVLAAEDPSQLHEPFQVSELYQSILPYRSYKRQLRFDTNQDYEMAVLRLLAGEGGYASVEPAEVQEALIEEVEAVDPDPGAFREFAAARVQLNRSAVRLVMRAREAYAPPAPTSEPGLDTGPLSEYAPGEDEPDSTVHAPDPTVEGSEPAELREPVFEAVDPAPDSTTASAPGVEDAETCPHCDAALPIHRQVVYCPFCGKRVGEIQCRTCGDLIEITWSYCPTCGKSATGD